MRAIGEPWESQNGHQIVASTRGAKNIVGQNLYNDPVGVDELQTDICAVKLSFFIINYPFLFDILSQATDLGDQT